MKNSILCFLLFFLFSQLRAQESIKEKPFTYGVKAGINIAGVGGSAVDDVRNLTSILAPHVGVVAQYKITPVFSAVSELQYSWQGYRIGSSGESSSQSFHYLNIPFLFRVYSEIIPSVKNLPYLGGLYLEAGPQIGYLIGSGVRNEYNGKVSTENFPSKWSHSFDLGLSFGLGYELPFGLFASLRYNLGFFNIVNYKEMHGREVSDSGLFNRNFQIGIGYIF